jgi:GNAT superfamily N-acetyltransferase
MFRWHNTIWRAFAQCLFRLRAGQSYGILELEVLLMKIRLAVSGDFETVRNIVDITIRKIYPRYYPDDVVEYFLAHHSDDRIRADIDSGAVYLAEEGEDAVGTGSVHDDEICRMFVLPSQQGKGYGSALLRTLEARVAKEFKSSRLDSSLPAYSMYLKNGYFPVAWRKIETGEGRVLCYNAMEKVLVGINYDNRIFCTVSNGPAGEVSPDTVFRYHQEGRIVWAEYEGGEILKGFMTGTADDEGNLDLAWQQINRKLELRAGACRAMPSEIANRTGKIRLVGEWVRSGIGGAAPGSGELVLEEPN